MKIRNDYVSNSSSSSFIVDDHAAARMFYEDFKDDLGNGGSSVGDVKIGIRYKDDDPNSWLSTDFGDFIGEIESGKVKFEDVAKITFECDDWDSQGIMYLNFLYLYFKKMGFSPDDSNTEHEFRNGGSSFLTKVLDRLAYIGKKEEGGKEDEDKK